MSTPCGRARGRALVLAAALGLAVASPLAASEASAAPTRAEKQDARAAWTKGRKEAARKRWSQAAELFRDAVDRDPEVQYQLDLVRALIAEGSLREASDVLDGIDAAREEASATERRAADDLRQKVEMRLATIVVEVKGPTAGLVVDVDGEEVKPGDAVRLDPGKHLVRAKAPGWTPMEQTVQLKERQTEAVEFVLERDGAAPGEEEEPAAEPAGDEEPAEEEADGGGTLLPAAIAWGVGGVGIGLGTVFGIFAFDEAEKAREGCVENVCPASSIPALDASRNNGTASTVFFAIGGAGIATGVVLAIVYGGGDEPPAKEAAGIRPWIGGSEIGVEGRF